LYQYSGIDVPRFRLTAGPAGVIHVT
jgi:hypothetical protein